MEYAIGILSFSLFLSTVSAQGFMGMEPIISPTGSGNGIHSVTNNNPSPNARPNGAGGAPNNPAMETVQNPNRLAMAPFLGNQGRAGTVFSRPTNHGNPDPNNLVNMIRRPPQPTMVVKMPHLCQTASWSTDSMVVMPMPMSSMKTAVGTLPLREGIVTQQGRRPIPYSMGQIMMLKARNQMMSMAMHEPSPMEGHPMVSANNMVNAASGSNMMNRMVSMSNNMNNMASMMNNIAPSHSVMNNMVPLPEPIAEPVIVNNIVSMPQDNMMNNMAQIPEPNMMNNMVLMPEVNMMNNMAQIPEQNMINNMVSMPEVNMMNNMAPIPEPNMINNMASMPQVNMMNNMVNNMATSLNMMNNMASMPNVNTMTEMSAVNGQNVMNRMSTSNQNTMKMITSGNNMINNVGSVMSMMATSQNGGAPQPNLHQIVWMGPSSKTMVAMSYPNGPSGSNKVRLAVY